MAGQIITTSSNSPGINVSTTTDFEFIYIVKKLTRASIVNDALLATRIGANINLFGTLVSSIHYAVNLINLFGAEGNFRLYVGSTGKLTGLINKVTVVDDNNIVTNLGEITGGSRGVESIGSNLQLTNSGAITGQLSDAVYISGNGANVINYGLIQALTSSTLADGIELFNSGSGGSRVTNYGTVSAVGGKAILGDPFEADQIFNFGLINGDVSLVGGGDLFRNGGDVVGDVDLGNGNDTYRGGAGTVEGTVRGGVGGDTLLGGSAEEKLLGQSGADVLRGRGGDDTLVGGGSRDILSGGEGADSFDFKIIADSGPGGLRDRITDFTRGEDVIDLSALDARAGTGGNQAFTFIGGQGFHNAEGELRVATAGANSSVEGDVDGDGTADFAVLVLRLTGLQASDFVL